MGVWALRVQGSGFRVQQGIGIRRWALGVSDAGDCCAGRISMQIVEFLFRIVELLVGGLLRLVEQLLGLLERWLGLLERVLERVLGLLERLLGAGRDTVRR